MEIKFINCTVTVLECSKGCSSQCRQCRPNLSLSSDARLRELLDYHASRLRAGCEETERKILELLRRGKDPENNP